MEVDMPRLYLMMELMFISEYLPILKKMKKMTSQSRRTKNAQFKKFKSNILGILDAQKESLVTSEKVTVTQMLTARQDLNVVREIHSKQHSQV